MMILWMKHHSEEENYHSYFTRNQYRHSFCGDALLDKAYQFFGNLEPELFKNAKFSLKQGAVLCEDQQNG